MDVLDPLRLRASRLTEAQRWDQRYRLVKFRADYSGPEFFDRPSAWGCSRPAGDHVEIGITASGRTHVKGLQRCRSVGSCPYCSPVIRQRRAADIEALSEAALATGKRVHMLTLTLQHRASSSLVHSLDVLRDAWRKMRESRATRAVVASAGVHGLVKVLEVTFGENGWHPHFHMLIVSDKSPGGLIDCWRKQVEGLGLDWVPRLTADLRPVTSSAGIARYLSKVEGGWSVGSELGGNAKAGRKGSYSSPELLAMAAEYGEDSPAFNAWVEWERGTKGVRFFEWSRGLRAKAGDWQLQAFADGAELVGVSLVADEVSDGEAVEVAPDEPFVFWVKVSSRTWSRAYRRGLLGRLLWSVRAGQVDGFACERVRPRGREPVPC